MIRSIFPRFNPDLPLDRQQYYPTQNAASPTTVPQSAISRSHEYSNSPINGRVPSIRSPLSAPPTQSSFPRGVLDIPCTPEPSTSEELKQLWKVTNGWRVSASEGRTFNLKMKSNVEEPTHTLCAADGNPFYHIRIDPTSTSAILTMTRHDPNKGSSPSSSTTILRSPMLGGKVKEGNGLEVLATTLEETSRRHSPNDGLVALLCPKAAAEVALTMAAKSTSEEALKAAADFEVGRLVWDDDTSKYYLSHPSLNTPFCMAVKEYKAWSKVEYVLEHPLMPFNLVKLVRDGAGGGSLEIDTGVASRIESYYLVDVAVAATIIVALEEEKKHNMERFEAPPPVPAKSPTKTSPKLSSILDGKLGGSKKIKIQEMEVDLESQSSIKKEGSDLPKPTKGALRLLYWAFKFIVWCLTVTVKGLAAIIIGLSKCLTKKGIN